jgi:tetratricopeptide (TPR) repeat protein
LLLGLALAVLGCASGSSTGVPVIAHQGDYDTALRKAEELSRDGLQKINLDEELTVDDKTNLTSAAAQFEGLVAFEPKLFAPHLALGMIYRGLGNLDSAEKNLRQCLTNLPEDKTEPVRATANEAHYQLSRVLFDKGDFNGALDEANKAVKGDRLNPNYFVGQASALAQLNRKADAIRSLNAALKLDPEHRRARGLMNLLSRSAGA